MPEHRTDAAAAPAPDDMLREQLAETIERELRAHPTITATRNDPGSWGVIGTFGGMSPHALADALLPLIRDHVAAAVQAGQDRISRHYASVAEAATRRAEKAEAVLRDIADHGLRADLNPTMPSSDSAALYVRWSEYLRRIDASVRQRARAALDGTEATP